MASISGLSASIQRSPVYFEDGKRITTTAPTARKETRSESTSSPVTVNSSVYTEPGPMIESSIRTKLDSGYKELGSIANENTSGKDWYEKVGFNDLSREDLATIIANQSGEYSEIEIDVAHQNLIDRQVTAMKVADPGGTDPAAASRAAIDFLDQAGSEEMATLGWAKERASAQWSYERLMNAQGFEPENLDSGNHIVNLFVRGYDELASQADPNQDVSDMPSFVEATRQWHLRQATTSSYLIGS